MPISSQVHCQMFQPSATGASVQELIRSPMTRQQYLSPGLLDPATTTTQPAPLAQAPSTFGVPWTPAEHERLLEATELFPSGPWRRVAEHVGSKTARQAMSHAQEYRQKIARRRRDLEQQAGDAQSTGDATTQPSTGTLFMVASKSTAFALDSNCEDIHVENVPERTVVPVSGVAAFEDSILNSLGIDKLSGEGHSGGDFNHPLSLWDANNLVDQQLLYDSTALLGHGANSVPFSILPWNFDELFAFEAPLSGGESTLHSSSCWTSSRA